MESQQRIWTPKTMAAALGIHPNTIRMYERIGLISKPARKPNGYRVLTDVHLLQLRICRIIFGCPYANRAIRDTGTRLVAAAARLDMPECRKASADYLAAIQREIGQAEKTRQVLSEWLAEETAREKANENANEKAHEKAHENANEKANMKAHGTVNRTEAARLVGVTVETIRNWERNGLLPVAGVGSRSERLYPATSLGRMRIIYMLRRTGYSMQAILRCLAVLDQPVRTKGSGSASSADSTHGESLRLRMLRALEMPETPDEPVGFVIMGDRWLDSLHDMEADALRVFPLVAALDELS